MEKKIENLQDKWVDLSSDEKYILGRPNFSCCRIAQRMREMGFKCETKAEDEQAMVIFTMLQFYKTYGTDWDKEMNKYLKEGKVALTH